MALGDVGDLVGDDRGQFVFRARTGNQAGMNADNAVRPGEGVDFRVVDDEKVEIATFTGLAGDFFTDTADITQRFRVVVQVVVGVQCGRKGLAELGFGLRIVVFKVRGAEVGQVIGSPTGGSGEQ